MSDTICLLIYMPYHHQKTLVRLPKTCTVEKMIEKLEEMYGQPKGGINANYLYFPERKWLLEGKKTLQEHSIGYGSILYWI